MVRGAAKAGQEEAEKTLQNERQISMKAQYKITQRGALFALVEQTTGNAIATRGNEGECIAFARRMGLAGKRINGEEI